MGILAVIVVLLVLLLASTWSSAKSYFAKGRLAGMEEATLDIIRGINAHYESAGQPAPEHVTKAVEAVRTFARGSSHEKSIYRYQARLWIFGDAVGAACWRKGYEACRQLMTARDDRIRIDLSVGELMHLSALAHLGFKKMMPNDRGIEMHRFDGEDHALEGAHAVERLERFIPEQHKPADQGANRRALIRALVAVGAQDGLSIANAGLSNATRVALSRPSLQRARDYKGPARERARDVVGIAAEWSPIASKQRRSDKGLLFGCSQKASLCESLS
jgi:hypothetical protein